MVISLYSIIERSNMQTRTNPYHTFLIGLVCILLILCYTHCQLNKYHNLVLNVVFKINIKIRRLILEIYYKCNNPETPTTSTRYNAYYNV